MKNTNFSEVPKVSKEATKEYGEKLDFLIKKVNKEMSQKEKLNKLIGDNPMSKMEENHSNHASFMYNSFQLNDSKLFINTIIWVYKTYNEQGFSYDYFPVELNEWISAIKKYMSNENKDSIIKVYKWMLKHHKTFIQKSKTVEVNKSEIPEKHLDLYNKFLKYLLQGKYNKCLKISKDNVTNKEEMIDFFEYIIKPAMYEIGELWAGGEISIAKEHLTSSIVSRINSSLYSQFISLEITKGKVVISPISNEFHELGARIIADSLETNGWEIYYLGANTPLNDLIDLLITTKPTLVGLSAAMPFNIDNLKKTVKKIREQPELKDMKILVGGKVLNDNPELWKKIGADGWAKDSQEAIQIAEKWLKEARDKNV